MNNLSPSELIVTVIVAPLLLSSLVAWVISLGHDHARQQDEPNRPYGWEERRE